jgi:hypothetical protein
VFLEGPNGEPPVQLHGTRAALLWGYREVAGLRMWRIIKGAQGWVLTATLERTNRFEVDAGARCHELLFTAPRDKGRWCFPVLDVSLTPTALHATVGAPVQ